MNQTEIARNFRVLAAISAHLGCDGDTAITRLSHAGGEFDLAILFPKTKHCTLEGCECGNKALNFTHFNINSQMTDGLQSYCKKGQKAYAVARKTKGPDKSGWSARKHQRYAELCATRNLVDCWIKDMETNDE